MQGRCICSSGPVTELQKPYPTADVGYPAKRPCPFAHLSSFIHQSLDMSDLPKYTRTPHTDETDALVKGGRRSLDSESESTVYPPIHAESSSGSGTTARRHVTYRFRARWPVQGSDQKVFGLLGNTRRVCMMPR